MPGAFDRRPEQVEALIVQNGNAYAEGLLGFWDPIKKYWNDPNASLLDPTAWAVDQVGLDRPGNAEIQLDLLYDYRTNVPLYPAFQDVFRRYKPPTLIVWGKNDAIFPAEGAAPYKRDLPDVETHLLDTGHFALETHGEEIAGRVEAFLLRKKESAS